MDIAPTRARSFDDEARTWDVSPRFALAVFVLPFAGVLLFAIDFVHGDLGRRLLLEDSLVEWATAIALIAAAAFAGIVAGTLWRGRQSAHALIYALVFVAALVAAGEEISWGQRLLGLDTPDAVREANLQGELNIHNLDTMYELYVMGMMIIGLYGSVGSWFVYRFKGWTTPNCYLLMPPFFLAGAFLQLALYRFVRHIGAGGHDYGEWCEFCVAAAVAIFIGLNARRLRHEAPGARPAPVV